MKVTFLGTGTSGGVPMIGCTCKVCQSTDSKDKRLRASCLVQINNKNILIDCGPDFRQQMLRAGINRIDALLITHEHYDHIAGLDDLRALNYIHKKPIEVYCNQQTEHAIRSIFAYAFNQPNIPGLVKLNFNRIDDQPFRVDEVEIIPIQTLHFKLPVLGFRIYDFTYITDANYIPTIELEKVKGSKAFVLNALRTESHISHFTLSEAIEIASKAGVYKTYFTHISHQMGRHNDVEQKLPINVFLTYDNLQIEC